MACFLTETCKKRALNPANNYYRGFSYTGKYTTQLLLSRGYGVRTLTYHPERENPFKIWGQTGRSPVLRGYAGHKNGLVAHSSRPLA